MGNPHAIGRIQEPILMKTTRRASESERSRTWRARLLGDKSGSVLAAACILVMMVILMLAYVFIVLPAVGGAADDIWQGIVRAMQPKGVLMP